MVNGRTTISRIYQVYGDEIGNFTIGPQIFVTIGGSTKQWTNWIIHIAPEEKSEKPPQKKQQEVAKFEILVDKSHVVVGEKIRFSLKLAGVSEMCTTSKARF